MVTVSVKSEDLGGQCLKGWSCGRKLGMAMSDVKIFMDNNCFHTRIGNCNSNTPMTFDRGAAKLSATSKERFSRASFFRADVIWKK